MKLTALIASIILIVPFILIVIGALLAPSMCSMDFEDTVLGKLVN
jgi:hypothetical protein